MTKSIRKLKIDCETSADLAIKTDSSSVCLYSSVGNWFALNLLIVLGAQKEQCTNIIKRNNVLFSGISPDLEVYIKVYISDFRSDSYLDDTDTLQSIKEQHAVPTICHTQLTETV